MTIIAKKEPYSVHKELVVMETDLCDHQCSEKPSLCLWISIPPSSSPPSATFSCCYCKCYCVRYQFLSRKPLITRAQFVNQKDLMVDELANLADRVMLSQASLHNQMAQAGADHHNDEVSLSTSAPHPHLSRPRRRRRRPGLFTLPPFA